MLRLVLLRHPLQGQAACMARTKNAPIASMVALNVEISPVLMTFRLDGLTPSTWLLVASASNSNISVPAVVADFVIVASFAKQL